MATYVYPNVGRAGLGNCLFPWARAELFAKQYSLEVINPHWSTMRIGPQLRGELEKRQYRGLLKSTNYITGWKRRFLLTFGRRIEEKQIIELSHVDARYWQPLIIEFEGIAEMFAPLEGHFQYLKDRLWEMTVPAFRPKKITNNQRYIAMHIRRGDITRQGFSAEQLDQIVCQFTPTSWFAAMARQLCDHDVTRGLPIVVFTDGYPDEIAEVTSLPGVELHKNQKAITDLWALANASLLFASGFSTFSMWASYLGGMPTFYAPNKLQQKVQVGRPEGIEFELSIDQQLPSQALAKLGGGIVWPEF